MSSEQRAEQMFPTLTPAQRAEALRFASVAPRRYKAAEALFSLGDLKPARGSAESK